MILLKLSKLLKFSFGVPNLISFKKIIVPAQACQTAKEPTVVSLLTIIHTFNGCKPPAVPYKTFVTESAELAIQDYECQSANVNKCLTFIHFSSCCKSYASNSFLRLSSWSSTCYISMPSMKLYILIFYLLKQSWHRCFTCYIQPQTSRTLPASYSFAIKLISTTALWYTHASQLRSAKVTKLQQYPVS